MAQEIIQSGSDFQSLIERVALNPEANVSNIEKLYELREREIKRIAEEDFFAAFAEMKKELPSVIRTKKNTQTNSKYAPIEEINKTVEPILAKYGFSLMTPIESQTGTSVTAAAVISRSNGSGKHSERTSVMIPLDDKGIKGVVNKTPAHATKSSTTYARNVAICALLNISMEGDDDDGNGACGNYPITTDQAANFDVRLRAISEQALPNFLKWAGVESLMEISSRNYRKCEMSIKDMESRAKAKVTK